MRTAIALIALALTTGATAPQEVPLAPAPGAKHALAITKADSCIGRIELVRQERGQPALQRDAKTEEGLLIAAVDHKVDGCSVLVMRNDTSDIRPVPTIDEPAQVRPLR
ncbi:hypothetical protein [Altererythrobacter sp. Root672]|uniref:hypothetical protein n=1 Tax=Altererythrobacter sp. Root672 TaxID=1736584 RepID=UPI0006FE5330|nr:hypothetical protein [Altererythrobacter sp. Root672]KRA83297.1 hypothetical protein ASD76_04360 [Altererythrobacter sp. Root672]